MCSRANLLIPGCGEGKYSACCMPSDKEVGDRPQIHSHLVLEWGCFYFLRGRTKSLKFIIVLWRLIPALGVRAALVYDSVARWFLAWKWSRSVVTDPLWPHGLWLPGSCVHRIFQARILEWVAISFPSRSSWPRDWTQVSRIVRQMLYSLSHQGNGVLLAPSALEK